MVINKESIVSLYEPKIIALWAQVTEKPERINTNVLNNGNSNTGITKIPSGGNIEPISIAGHNAAWKNAQKNPKNNINSDTINNKNPKRNPNLTGCVWNPEKVASSTISLHQIYALHAKVNKEIKNK